MCWMTFSVEHNVISAEDHSFVKVLKSNYNLRKDGRSHLCLSENYSLENGPRVTINLSSVCAGESQGGNPIGKALVLIIYQML